MLCSVFEAQSRLQGCLNSCVPFPQRASNLASHSRYVRSPFLSHLSWISLNVFHIDDMIYSPFPLNSPALLPLAPVLACQILELVLEAGV